MAAALTSVEVTFLKPSFESTKPTTPQPHPRSKAVPNGVKSFKHSINIAVPLSSLP